jgi:hypothetical protein
MTQMCAAHLVNRVGGEEQAGANPNQDLHAHHR